MVRYLKPSSVAVQVLALAWLMCQNFEVFASTPVRSIAAKAETIESTVFDVGDAGKNQRVREEAARQRKLKIFREQQKRIAAKKERAAQAAKIRQAEKERERLLELRRAEEAEERLRAEKEARIKEEQERVARDEAARKEEQERVARIAKEQFEREQQKAHEERLERLKPFASSIKVIGFWGNRALIVLPDQPNRALLLGPGESSERLSLSSIDESVIRIVIEGETFDVKHQRTDYLFYDPTANSWDVSFILDLQRRINRATHYGSSSFIRFTIQKGGEPAQFDSDSEYAVKTILSAAPFRPMPEFAKSLQVAVSLGSAAQARITSIELELVDVKYRRRSLQSEGCGRSIILVSDFFY